MVRAPLYDGEGEPSRSFRRPSRPSGRTITMVRATLRDGQGQPSRWSRPLFAMVRANHRDGHGDLHDGQGALHDGQGETSRWSRRRSRWSERTITMVTPTVACIPLDGHGQKRVAYRQLRHEHAPCNAHVDPAITVEKRWLAATALHMRCPAEDRTFKAGRFSVKPRLPWSAGRGSSGKEG